MIETPFDRMLAGMTTRAKAARAAKAATTANARAAAAGKRVASKPTNAASRSASMPFAHLAQPGGGSAPPEASQPAQPSLAKRIEDARAKVERSDKPAADTFAGGMATALKKIGRA